MVRGTSSRGLSRKQGKPLTPWASTSEQATVYSRVAPNHYPHLYGEEGGR